MMDRQAGQSAKAWSNCEETVSDQDDTRSSLCRKFCVDRMGGSLGEWPRSWRMVGGRPWSPAALLTLLHIGPEDRHSNLHLGGLTGEGRTSTSVCVSSDVEVLVAERVSSSPWIYAWTYHSFHP